MCSCNLNKGRYLLHKKLEIIIKVPAVSLSPAQGKEGDNAGNVGTSVSWLYVV